jgi:hypothetical protein
MSRPTRTRYVVVALQEDGTAIPEVVGPFRNKDKADAEARQWNLHYSGFTATVRPLEHGPSIRRHLGVGR